MNEILVVVDYGQEAEELNETFLAETPKAAFEKCLKECKRIMDDLLFAGFRSKLHVNEDQLTVENIDDHSKINFFLQPILSKKKEPVLFAEEQACM